jgi:GxxExxY protein
MTEYIHTEDWIVVKEPLTDYTSVDELTYKIIGCCYEVHKVLGKGFSEIIYKDVLEYELKQKDLSFIREKKFDIAYKDIILPHYYFADFIVENMVILEIKAQQVLVDENIKQVINYLAASKCKTGLLINFGESSLKYKRVVLNK